MKKAINTNKAPLPVGPYNQAVLVDKTLYISGQVALNPKNNELIQGSIKEETHQIMKNIKSILNEAGLEFEEWKDSDWIRKTTGQMGYAHYYLDKCWDDSRRTNEADALVYKKLVDIDSELGMDASQQLFCCLWSTTRSDIIKVYNVLRIKFF